MLFRLSFDEYQKLNTLILLAISYLQRKLSFQNVNSIRGFK
ncbi:hypothetical protein PPHE_b0491 [Pseudoalteromonas phenolica O-BC30]|nr:hypothetical protein [Pseudoalteromonas phenolica O-BC30]